MTSIWPYTWLYTSNNGGLQENYPFFTQSQTVATLYILLSPHLSPLPNFASLLLFLSISHPFLMQISPTPFQNPWHWALDPCEMMQQVWILQFWVASPWFEGWFWHLCWFWVCSCCLDPCGLSLFVVVVIWCFWVVKFSVFGGRVCSLLCFYCNFSNWVLWSGGVGIWVVVILLNFFSGFFFFFWILNFDSWRLD